MFIKDLAHKITGRKCIRCKHSHKNHCCHPDYGMFMRCFHSIFRPGFEKRPPRYLKTTPDLTPHEQHELQKIRNVLQTAEDGARDSGLLED